MLQDERRLRAEVERLLGEANADADADATDTLENSRYGAQARG